MTRCIKCKKIIWLWQEAVSEVNEDKTIYTHKQCAEEEVEEKKLNRKEKRKKQFKEKKNKKDNIPQQECIPSVKDQETDVIPAEAEVVDRTLIAQIGNQGDSTTSPPGNLQDQSGEVNSKEESPKV